MEENQKFMELLKLQRDMQLKYAYFILAINGSAIAYVIQLTVNRLFDLYLVFIFLSLICWGLSFYFGCLFLLKLMLANNINLAMLMPQPTQVNGLLDNQMTIASKASNKRFKWMFYFLQAGILLFIAWYIFSFYNRSLQVEDYAKSFFAS